MNNILHALNEFWEVEHRPQTDLRQLPEENLITPKKANWITICITIFLLAVSVICVSAGAL